MRLISFYANNRAYRSLQYAKGLLLSVWLLLLAHTLVALTLPDLKNKAAEQYGDSALGRIIAWEQLIRDHQDAALPERLQYVNTFFNEQVTWVSDSDAWETEDYWATPLETMGRAKGDCEDFSIAKYATLLLMNVEPASLRLVYVKASRGGITQAHMVLAWYQSPAHTPLILDNIDFNILPATERGDLFPVFSFNATALWVGGKTAPSSANPVTRLSRWRTVLAKMREEGFALDV